MKIWLITDTHFGHDKMVEFCGRDPDFSQIILKNLCNIIWDDSIIIHLGDVCIGNDAHWHDEFLGSTAGAMRRILIRGNHDRKSNSWYLNAGWNFIAETISDTMFGKNVLLSHFPIKDTGYDINIHGHFHNSDHRSHEADFLAIKNPKHKLLAIENTNLKPVKLQEFLTP